MCGSYHSCAVDALWHDLSLAYERHIEATGKEMHFLILLSFLGSFGFIRTSAHMIRAQVSWWPGNVETKGGTHIHHMFWGILLLMTMGYLGLATDMGSPWLELTGIAFGIGLGLTLDEFALWLNLQDVYWSQKGRQSIDAVIVATLMLVVALIGLQFWIDVARSVPARDRHRRKALRRRREPAVAAGLPADRHHRGRRLLAEGQAPVRHRRRLRPDRRDLRCGHEASRGLVVD